MKKYVIYLLTVLRILVGWHFLYEGISKLFISGWSAKMYLLGSKWLFSGFFNWMASSPDIMKIVDFLNVWGLILIGMSLFVGLFVRWSSIFGAMLLLFYFVAYPPIPGYTFGTISEGSYLWVNKTLIELFILIIFAGLPSEFYFGADRLIKRWREEKPCAPVPKNKNEHASFGRREVLRDLVSVPFIGAFAYGLYKKRRWDSFEEKVIKNTGGIVLNNHIDASSGATARSLQFSSLQDLKGIVPKGKIENMEVSRLYMGGNLLNGFAHARDLIYVNKLVKGYHTEERIMMTLQLAEKCGINTLMAIPGNLPFMEKYRRETGGKMQFISDCGWGDFVEGAKLSIDGGATACYAQGGTTDTLVQKGDFDTIARGIDLIRKNGLPAGIGAHLIESVQACVKVGIKPDFWVKTLHEHNYWSAKVDQVKLNTLQKGFMDNIFDFRPQETIDFMNQLEEPWIAFKVLAAGAIKPEDGFPFAFNNGADFICVGMYDFQIVDDVNIALESLKNVNRTRPWRG
jgi:uncharacterized membrane protein YphA (DoxX/SURF4 family)